MNYPDESTDIDQVSKFNSYPIIEHADFGISRGCHDGQRQQLKGTSTVRFKDLRERHSRVGMRIEKG